MKKITPIFWSNLAVFLICSSSMLVPRSNYAGAVILLVNAAVCFKLLWPPQQLPKDVKYFFISLCLLALSWSIDGFLSGRGMASIEKPLKIVLVIPCFYYLMSNPPKIEWLWRGCIVGCVGAAMLASYHVFFVGLPRAGEGYINENFFGGISLLLALLCACAWFDPEWKKKNKRLLLSLGFACGLFASILSASRGSWLVFFIILIIFGTMQICQKKSRITLLISCLVMAAALLVWSVPQFRVQKRVQLAYNEVHAFYKNDTINTSVGARLAMWRLGYQLYKEKPVFGWTQKGVKGELEKWIEREQPDPVSRWKTVVHLHSDIIDTAAKRGIVGLIILLSCHVTCFMFFFNRFRLQKYGNVASLAMAGMLLPVSFFCFGLTETFMTASNTIVMYFYLAAILMASILNKTKVKKI